MRKLHLVGFTADRKGLIFSVRRGSKSGSFVVAFEDSFVDTLVAEQRRRDAGEELQPEPEAVPDTRGGVGDDIRASIDRRRRPESTLTPREMQARLRAGRTIVEVAREARVDPEWVERFAVPILAEQAQMVELARNLTYSKPRRGPSAEPLGPSASENLIDRGVMLMDDVFDAAWTANQLHDVVWVVRLRYRSRGRDQEALWEVNVATGKLTARNRLASALGFVDERQRRARPGSPESDAPPEPEPVRRTTKAPGTRRSGGAKTAAKTSAAAARGRKRAAGSTATRPSTARTGRTARPATKAAGAAKPKKASGAAKAKKATAARPKATRAASKPRVRPAKATRTRKAAATGRKATAPARKATAPARKAPASKRTAKRAPPAAPATAAPRAMKTGHAVAAAKPRVRVGTDGSPGSRGAAAANGSPVGRGRSPDATAAALATAPARVPINRLATDRVAASRAAAGRLSGDRRVANPVPPAADEGIGALRRQRSVPAQGCPTSPPSRPAPLRSRPAPPPPAASGVPMPVAATPPPRSTPPPPPIPPPPIPSRRPSPPPDDVTAHDDHDDRENGKGDPPSRGPSPPEPQEMMHIDDLLESVDFEEKAKPRSTPNVRLLIAGQRAGDMAAARDTRRPATPPLRAWPLGAG